MQLVGFLTNVNYQLLREKLGEPTSTFGDKTIVEWDMTTDGTLLPCGGSNLAAVSVYDWKTDRYSVGHEPGEDDIPELLDDPFVSWNVAADDATTARRALVEVGLGRYFRADQ